VIRRIILSVFAVTILLFATEGVMGQQSSPCVTGGVSNVPQFGYNCEGWGGGVPLWLCYGQTSACAPAGAAGEGGDGGGGSCGSMGAGGGGGAVGGGGSNATAGRPICLLDGNTYIDQTDFNIPGLGNGLSLVRRWNSVWPSSQSAFQIGLFGPNWRSTYEERVFLGSDGYVKYARSDGRFWSFGIGGPGWAVAAPANAGATLVRGGTYWTLTLKSGEQRHFDINSGSLTAIIDRNGNTTQLSYDGLNRLVTVTDPASRHLTFTYQNNTSFLVTSVTSDVGLTVSYAYDNNNRLSQVTLPDQSTLTFQYDSNSNITAVRDTNGKVLESHTYDSSHRGLTSSRANGVESLSITYQ
jgi:YD repeat-containing protein